MTPQVVEKLLTESGIGGAVVMPEDVQQPFAHPDDWWKVVLGSGYRSTLDQMSTGRHVTTIETNVIYAVATRM